MKSVIASVLCFGVLIGCDSSGDFIDGDVSGFVVDAQTGEPLADATVRFVWERPPEPGQVLSMSSVRDDGTYVNQFRAVGTCETRGDMTLRAEAPGYKSSGVVRVLCLDGVVEGEADFELSAAG